MKKKKKKLEKELLNSPECVDFLNNFFNSCDERNLIENFLNYRNDLLLYSSSCEPIRKNYRKLLDLFEDVTGLRIYRENR